MWSGSSSRAKWEVPSPTRTHTPTAAPRPVAVSLVTSSALVAGSSPAGIRFLAHSNVPRIHLSLSRLPPPWFPPIHLEIPLPPKHAYPASTADLPRLMQPRVHGSVASMLPPLCGQLRLAWWWGTPCAIAGPFATAGHSFCCPKRST